MARWRERNRWIKKKWRGASQLGEHNGSELNQQSALMLMLLCLFKLIIKDRAPPSPRQRSGEFVSAVPCRGNWWWITPFIKSPPLTSLLTALSPSQKMFSLASADGNLDPEYFFIYFFFSLPCSLPEWKVKLQQASVVMARCDAEP